MRGSIATSLLLALVLIGFNAEAGPLKTTHCPWGCPDHTPSADTIVKREIYDLAADPKTKFPDWVAYAVTSKSIGHDATRDWRPDENLGNNALAAAEFDGEADAHGYEMGHIAPLADFTSLPKDTWEEANILSNITPQCGTLNNGHWKGLETAERQLAKGQGTIWVVAGTLYTGEMPGLPRSKHSLIVPSAFWKVIAVKNGSKIEVAAFEFDQYTLEHKNMCARGAFKPGSDFCGDQVPMADIEHQTDLDLFPLAAKSAIVDSKITKGTTIITALGCPKKGEALR